MNEENFSRGFQMVADNQDSIIRQIRIISLQSKLKYTFNRVEMNFEHFEPYFILSHVIFCFVIAMDNQRSVCVLCNSHDYQRIFLLLKGIVSWDWGGLLMVSVDRYNILDIARKYLFLYFKVIFIFKIFKILIPLRRALPGSKVFWPVLSNHKFSARSTKW
jgi:hypothetical protein